MLSSLGLLRICNTDDNDLVVCSPKFACPLPCVPAIMGDVASSSTVSSQSSSAPGSTVSSSSSCSFSFSTSISSEIPILWAFIPGITISSSLPCCCFHSTKRALPCVSGAEQAPNKALPKMQPPTAALDTAAPSAPAATLAPAKWGKQAVVEEMLPQEARLTKEACARECSNSPFPDLPKSSSSGRDIAGLSSANCFVAPPAPPRADASAVVSPNSKRVFDAKSM
mmetsp:Transcript_125720/g.402386  ORF Transcript_125720/g.402386 Transcript_125720/m.402386 type:complete len:225 (-) Transcript_125720:862-1536(-)